MEKTNQEKKPGNKALLTQIKHISQYPMTYLSTNPKVLKSLPFLVGRKTTSHHFVGTSLRARVLNEIRSNRWIHFEEVVRSVNPK